jgi:hypothetical protein
MARFNQLGQWTLQGDEQDLMFKTGEQKSAPDYDSKDLKKGADVINEQFVTMDMQVSTDKHGQKLQPTDEELFGHLVVSEEELQKRDQQWETTISDNLNKVREPVDNLNKNERLDFKWEDGKSFNDYLSEAEVAERNKTVG